MNERINELLEQAGYNPAWSTKADREEYLDLEKFAQLIIQACVQKVSEWDMGINDLVGSKDATSQVARDIVAEIKEHFGAEE